MMQLRTVIPNHRIRCRSTAVLSHSLSSAADLDQPFTGKSMIMIFEKPSTRTRISFDIAVKQLGGSTIILNTDNIHYGIGNESIKDTAKILSEYTDVVMIRTSQHKKLEEFAKYSNIPVINGLSEQGHPCQIMSDILTFEEKRGSISGKEVLWIGDGNNVCNSLIQASAKFNFLLKFSGPSALDPDKKVVKAAIADGAAFEIQRDVDAAVKSADLIITDSWVSMHHSESDRSSLHNVLSEYQVNENLMKKAKKEALFMHCLPAHRGEEVTSEVLDGKSSVVFDEAENRLHVQKAIMRWCLNKIKLTE